MNFALALAVYHDPYRYGFLWRELHEACGLKVGDKIPAPGFATTTRLYALNRLAYARQHPQMRYKLPYTGPSYDIDKVGRDEEKFREWDRDYSQGY